MSDSYHLILVVSNMWCEGPWTWHNLTLGCGLQRLSIQQGILKSISIEGISIESFSIERIGAEGMCEDAVIIHRIALYCTPCDGLDRIRMDLHHISVHCVGHGIQSITKKKIIGR